MNKASIAIHAIERTSQMIFWVLAASIFILASLYVNFVIKTVWNVAARQTAESEIVAINSDLSATEFEYISSKAKITFALAESMGFKPADKQTLFVTRINGTKSVAFR